MDLITTSDGYYVMPSRLKKEQIFAYAREIAAAYKTPKSYSNPKAFYNSFRDKFIGLDQEHFCFLTLNNSNNVIGFHEHTIGSMNSTLVDVRLIVKQLLDDRATTLVLMHNHPSGHLKASQADINLTKKIKDACGLFDIYVLDHIILTDNKYFSFADEGML